MSSPETHALPDPSPDQRKIAAERFERANQVISSGDYDYGMQLLLTCCKIDPANLIYRQTLRRTQKAKFKNNMRGSRFAVLSTSAHKARIKASKRGRDFVRVLEQGEDVLCRNPWDLGTQLDMAESADAMGLLDLAVWLLEQARQRDGQDVGLNRTLARLYEKRGNFSQAIALWELVKQAEPSDAEAQNKGKDLAANETISRGRYEQTAFQNRNDDTPEEPTGKISRAEDGTEVAPTDRVAREAAPFLAKIAGGSTEPLPYLQLAAVYTRSGRYDEAREVLTNGLAATGQHFQIRIEMMELELEPFRRNLALTEQKLEALPPTATEGSDDPDADGDAATLAEEERELRRIRVRLLKEINARELELYRLRADRYPNDMTNRVELGLRLLRAGQIDEAITALQQARKDPRQLWRALLYLGFAFKSRDNWKLARRNFEEALDQIPPSEENQRKEVLFQLASGHAEAGDFTNAIEVGNELANLEFTYREIGRLIDQWQDALDKR
jgi:tetratricopeptide (TPR) repeat protein